MSYILQVIHIQCFKHMNVTSDLYCKKLLIAQVRSTKSNPHGLFMLFCLPKADAAFISKYPG
jgi:hypothetical protein